jgi:hypothetical protein
MKSILILSILLFSFANFAGSDIKNLSRNDVDLIMKEFQASFYPTTVSGASSTGKVFGFEFGLVGGMLSADNLKRVTSNDVSKLPHASFYLKADTLYGLGAEVTLLPLSIGDFKYKNFSAALKWTFTDIIPAFPVNIRARVRIAKTDIDYKGNDGTIDYTGSIDNKSSGFDLTVSKKFVFIEPYLGFGYVTSKADFFANGSNNVFNFQASDSVTGIKNSGVHYFGGAHLGLGFLKLGVEYSRLFDQNRYLAKLGFGI